MSIQKCLQLFLNPKRNNKFFPASISVRNVRNTSTNLTVKADINDVTNRNHHNATTPTYYSENMDHGVQYSYQDTTTPNGHSETELHSTNPFLPSIKRTNFDAIENERNLLRVSLSFLKFYQFI